MMEAGVLLAGDRPIYWHSPANRTTVALPDSRPLWDVIWENRGQLSGMAHSHPGRGQPGPSYEDVTTFASIEQALGRRLDWWIISEDSFVLLRWDGPGRLDYRQPAVKGPIWFGGPSWIKELRRLSYEP